MLTQHKNSWSIGYVFSGYQNNYDTNGSITAMDGRLNIHPSFQRELVYSKDRQILLIDSILHGYDIGKFTFGATGEHDHYEVIDGQQRLHAIGEFIKGNIVVKDDNGTLVNYFSLSDQDRKNFLTYELDIIICDGTYKEKLAWFQRVNVAGMPLTQQELLNATYPSPWLESAKQYFSKRNCKAGLRYEPYLSGNPIRQDYLEQALGWISRSKGISIDDYMLECSTHQKDASELITYFETAMDWAGDLFDYDKSMKGLPWGFFYNQYHHASYSEKERQQIKTRAKELLIDEEVTNPRGIYEYVLSGESDEVRPKLQIRTFDAKMRKILYGLQGGRCIDCGEQFSIDNLAAHHIVSWNNGGKTNIENGVLLCKACHNKRHNY